MVRFTLSNLEAHSVEDEISNLNIIINVYIQLGEKKDPKNISF